MNTKVPSDKLLPCPFCGSTDIGGGTGIINCYECGVSTDKHSNIDNAVQAWNTRAAPTIAQPQSVPITRERFGDYLSDYIDGANVDELYATLIAELAPSAVPDGLKGMKLLPVSNIEMVKQVADFQILLGFKSCRAAGEFKATLEGKSTLSPSSTGNDDRDAELIALKCPNCDDDGYTIEQDSFGEPEQCQCQFCYTHSNSIFSMRAAIDTAIARGVR